MNRTTGIITESSDRNPEIDLCRLCREKHDCYYSIFTSNVACKISVKDALHDLVGLQVAVGDGLPTTMCPQCLKKLTEFSVFKKICLESNAILRKSFPSSCFRSFGGGADDEESEPCVESKYCIQDAIENTSEFTCSAQMTEVYIPVPDCLLPRDDKLFHVKDESEDPLSEGNSPMLYTSNPAAITSDASDPLATDDLPNTLTASQGKILEAQGTGAMVADLDWTLVGAKEEPSPEESAQTHMQALASTSSQWEEVDAEETGAIGIDLDSVPVLANKESPKETDATEDADCDHMQAQASSSYQGEEVDAEGTGAIVIDLDSMPVLAEKESPKETDTTEPTSENGELIQNQAMAMDSMTEAVGIPASARASALFALIEPKIRASNSRNGRSKIKQGILKANFGGKREMKSVREVRRNFIVDGKSCIDSPHTAKKHYFCGECEKSFCKKTNLVHHIRTHTKEKPYSCGECEKSFTQKRHLIDHIRTHTKERPYSCGECEKSFFQKSHLVYHIRTHAKEKPYSCGECDKSFSQKSDLVRHIRTHTKEKPYSCGECDKSFSQKSDLVRHIWTHTKEKRYSCGECEKSFTLKSHLKYHIRTHTKEKPYSCGECEKSFTQKSHLNYHIRTHTKEKPYSCGECEKSFFQKSHLVYHIRTHTKEKPYSCGECEKSFPFKSNLVRHLQAHTEEKSYACKECEKSYAAKRSLVLHMRVHNKEAFLLH